MIRGEGGNAFFGRLHSRYSHCLFSLPHGTSFTLFPLIIFLLAKVFQNPLDWKIKNLSEFWRQLWRVIERSDLVIQIVDSRNILLFRSQVSCYIFFDLWWSCLIMFDLYWSCLIIFNLYWSFLIMFDQYWSCLTIINLYSSCLKIFDLYLSCLIYIDRVWSTSIFVWSVLILFYQIFFLGSREVRERSIKLKEKFNSR